MLAVLSSMSFSEESSSSSSSLNGDAYTLLFNALYLIPISPYILALSLLFVIVIYNFLEFHFVEDIFSGFRGSPVRLTFNSSSPIYDGVVSKCKIVHGRSANSQTKLKHVIQFFSFFEKINFSFICLLFILNKI